MNEMMDLFSVENDSVYVLKIYSGYLGVIEQRAKKKISKTNILLSKFVHTNICVCLCERGRQRQRWIETDRERCLYMQSNSCCELIVEIKG